MDGRQPMTRPTLPESEFCDAVLDAAPVNVRVPALSVDRDADFSIVLLLDGPNHGSFIEIHFDIFADAQRVLLQMSGAAVTARPSALTFSTSHYFNSRTLDFGTHRLYAVALLSNGPDST